MDFRTVVDIQPSAWKIAPCQRMLFVGSCFADNIGKRFLDEKFRAVVNPFGVMYNPVSILHTVSRLYVSPSKNGTFAPSNNRFDTPKTVLLQGENTGVEKQDLCEGDKQPAHRPEVTVFTLGTNHVYREIETGEIVDNCRKRPARLFQEEELTVEQCADALRQAVEIVGGKVIITVSPIRYKKYGFHGSQLSKATLLLAAHRLASEMPGVVEYFPAYEIINDELRDYRFYQPDMLHPSAQAVEYIYTRFAETYFSKETNKFIEEWRPIKEALGHRPSNPDSEEYKAFLEATKKKAETLKTKYPDLEV